MFRPFGGDFRYSSSSIGVHRRWCLLPVATISNSTHQTTRRRISTNESAQVETAGTDETEIPPVNCTATTSTATGKSDHYEFQIKELTLSGLRNAGLKMEEIIDEMRRDADAPNPSLVHYSLLLRYYSSRGELAHLHRILQQMSTENVPPDMAAYNTVLYCCCKNQQISKAAYIMNHQLMEIDRYELIYQQNLENSHDESKNERTVADSSDENESYLPFNFQDDKYTQKIFQESIFNMLIAYRDAVISPSLSFEVIKQYVKDAEQLVARLQKNRFLLRLRNEANQRDETQHATGDIFDRITNILMVIYARVNRIEDAEALFAKSTSSNDLRYLALIKAYTTRALPERATALLHRLLNDKNVLHFNNSCFIAVTDGWADAAARNHADALKNAIQVVQLMDTNERCRQMKVRPCVSVFNGVIRCLSNLSPVQSPDQPDAAATTLDISFDPCETAVEVLNEMEARSKIWAAAVPNHTSYGLVLKACLRNNKLELVNQILQRMEKSHTPPDLLTYSGIMAHYSKLGTVATAKQTENVLEFVRYLSKTKPSLKPDVVCYSILLNAWLDSKSMDAAEQAWRIYLMVRNDGLSPDLFFASRIISFLSSHSVNTPSYYEARPQLQQQPDPYVAPDGLGSLASLPSTAPINLRRAAIILNEMILIHTARPAADKPNERVYRMVIKGFISVGDLVTATSFLLQMIEGYINGSNTNAKPNEGMMATVVMAWVTHGDLIKATLLFNKLVELYNMKRMPAGPDMGTYRTLCHHWERSRHPKKEFYLLELRSHMFGVDEANNLSSSSIEPSNDSIRNSDLNSGEQSSNVPPQTFLAIATAALRRQS